MRRRLPIMFAGLLALGAPSVAGADWNVRASLMVRTLDWNRWSHADQIGSGASLDFGGKSWPVHVVGAYFASDREDRTFCILPGLCGGDPNRLLLRESLSEWSLGVVKIWRPALRMRPFLGGGAAWVSGAIEDRETGVRGRDRSQGVYVSGGIDWAIGPDLPVRLHWGIEARTLAGTHLELAGTKGDANYRQVGVFAGLGW